MRLDIDRWSSSSTAVELIPCGRVRPTAAYFPAGHLLLDALTRSFAAARSLQRRPGSLRASRACPSGRPALIRRRAPKLWPAR